MVEEGGSGAATPARADTSVFAVTLPVHKVRGQRIAIDADIARLFEVQTRVFNQQVRRNAHRFPTGWMFELTAAEHARLTSQTVISNTDGGPGRGGRRTPPLAFTEHGVVMAATLLGSERATLMLQFVIEVFVGARRGELSGKGLKIADAPVATGFSQRLQQMIERLMERMVDDESQSAVRDEAQAVLRDSLDHIRARLSKAGLENEEIGARAAKLLAEAEATKAVAAKTSAEAEDIKLGTLAKKLELLLKAEAAISRGEIKDLMGVLKKLGR